MKLRHTLSVIILGAITFLTAQTSQAAMHVSLMGSHSQSNAGYQSIESGAGSAGVAFDLGQYFRLGFTHRQELSSTKGYKNKEETNTYVYFESLSHVTSNDVDLTLILYAGDIVTPFIFAGVGVRHYVTDMQEADGTREHMDFVYPGPQGGAGLSIRINQKFSLKLTYTMSPGVSKLPGEEEKSTLDNYTQVGISYTL
jgi:hypothetical protein